MTAINSNVSYAASMWASPAMLRKAFFDIARRSQAAGLDGVTPAVYEQQLETNLAQLKTGLDSGTYKPKPVLKIRKAKPDGRFRTLCIPSVQDRIVIEALRGIVEPVIETVLHPSAFAYRPRRSALAASDTVVKNVQSGKKWVMLTDIRDFFDSIPHRAVLPPLRSLPVPPSCLDTLQLLLTHHRTKPGIGLAQGAALSPALSNLAMVPLDNAMAKAGFALVRYCDNLCVTAADRATAHKALELVRSEAKKLGLRLKPKATQVVDGALGFEWLGFYLDDSGKRVSKGAVSVLRHRAEQIVSKTPNADVTSLLMPLVLGWTQYFRVPLPEHSDLGVHGPILRQLIIQQLGESVFPHEPTTTEPDSNQPAENGEDWLDMDHDGENWDVSWDLEGGAPEGADLLLTEAETLAIAGQFAEAEQRFFQAMTLQTVVAVPDEDPEGVPVVEEERIDVFLALFCAGQDGFEMADLSTANSGDRDYAWVDRPPGPADVQEHLMGSRSIAIRPRLPNNDTLLGVIDIDAVHADAVLGVTALAQAVAAVASRLGMRVLLEQTGGRGMHVWFPLQDPLPADELAQALRRLVSLAGRSADGVTVEIFPGQDDAPELANQAMALPCGKHSGTGNPSRLWWFDGAEIESDLSGILMGEPIPVAAFAPLVPAPLPVETSGLGQVGTATPDWSQFGKQVAGVMDGCSILRFLADKAAAVGHLNHAERLSILYTLGHLDSGGTRAIHAIVGKCRNYDVRETDRQIQKLTGLPIGCVRLKEKHPLPPDVEPCRCEFGNVAKSGGYPTPVLFAGGFRRQWREVLRGRRETAFLPRPTEGVVAVEVEPEADLPKLLPPHRWAAGALTGETP